MITKCDRPRILECLGSTPLQYIKNTNAFIFSKQDKYFNIYFFRRMYAQAL